MNYNFIYNQNNKYKCTKNNTYNNNINKNNNIVNNVPVYHKLPSQYSSYLTRPKIINNSSSLKYNSTPHVNKFQNSSSIKTILDSSKKLDELLNKCKELGSKSTEISSGPSRCNSDSSKSSSCSSTQSASSISVSSKKFPFNQTQSGNNSNYSYTKSFRPINSKNFKKKDQPKF
jgi:hypothetical protein